MGPYPVDRHLGKAIAIEVSIATLAMAAKAVRKIQAANKPIAVVRD